MTTTPSLRIRRRVTQMLARIGRVGAFAAVLITGMLLAPGVITAASAADYGPDTCLNGFVWRDARPGDHVCVTPGTRAQAAADNRAASARRNPAGPYGPDTCINGFVWREAYPGDHVCVTPPTRSQAAADNAAAADRRNAPRLWHSTYTQGARCSGDVCSRTSTDDIPRYRLHGDRVNPGRVVVELHRANGTLVKRWQPTAVRAGAAGGRFTLDTGVFACNGPKDSYFRVQDSSSGRWSAPYRVSANCRVL